MEKKFNRERLCECGKELMNQQLGIEIDMQDRITHEVTCDCGRYYSIPLYAGVPRLKSRDGVFEVEKEDQAVPYTQEEIKHWNTQCSVIGEVDLRNNICKRCKECSLRDGETMFPSEMFNYCGIIRHYREGFGTIVIYNSTKDSYSWYSITEAPSTSFTGKWGVIVDDATSAIGFNHAEYNEEAKRWEFIKFDPAAFQKYVEEQIKKG